MNFKRTKPFLLATAGSTVDGRTIDENMIKEMAKSYDPKTYGARLNIEHIRGVSGEKPFRAYGDVAELSTGEVDVNFNGTIEKRLGLFGAFDVTEDAQALNAAQQKVFPSIEIEPNFAGKGFAYLMGCAMTDSPASIATDRLAFNITRPGALVFSRDEGALLEFADDKGDVTPEGGNFLTALTGILDKFGANFGKKEDPQPVQQPAVVPGAIDMTALTGLFTDMGKAFQGTITAQTNAVRSEIDRIDLKVTNLAKDVETTPAGGQPTRPLANGNANFTKTAF
ncbi:MAG: GPO family capsid scaffolding protein [Proteobacteria bacterium]|nr:GPO family capsid scaffolding protein [Pseudomonadota bacterium]